jgi:hypothetical protein
LADITYGSTHVGSDTTWKVSSTGPSDWDKPGFDDSSWSSATDEGAYGSSPWYNSVANMPNSTPGRWIWNTSSPPCGGGTIYLRGTIQNN